MIVIIENLLVFQQAADTFIGAHPYISMIIFRNGTYMDIGQTLLTAIYFIVPTLRGWKTNQTFSRSYPHSVLTIHINSIDSIRGKKRSHVKKFNALKMFIKNP